MWTEDDENDFPCSLHSVLLFSMGLPVSRKSSPVAKYFATFLALMMLCCSVESLVFNEAVPHSKGSPTHITLKRFPSAVNFLVFDEV